MVFEGVQNICSQHDTLQAKLRMRRKENPQLARWAKPAPPKPWAESQGTRSLSYATEQGLGETGSGGVHSRPVSL